MKILKYQYDAAELDDGLVPNNQAKEYIAGMQAVLENEDYNRGLVQQEQPSRYVLKKIWDALQQVSFFNVRCFGRMAFNKVCIRIPSIMQVSNFAFHELI